MASFSSSEYPGGVGFSRVCLRQSFHRYFCFPFGVWLFRTIVSLLHEEQGRILKIMCSSRMVRHQLSLEETHHTQVNHYPMGQPLPIGRTGWPPIVLRGQILCCMGRHVDGLDAFQPGKKKPASIRGPRQRVFTGGFARVYQGSGYAVHHPPAAHPSGSDRRSRCLFSHAYRWR